MKVLAFFTVCLLAGSVYTAPASNTTDDDNISITSDFFLDELVIYTAEHDIVDIMLPLNSLNFEDDDDDNDDDEDFDLNTVIFFTLADTENGKRVDKGLYVRKNTTVTKLIDNGRVAVADNEETTVVYIGASDGIYTYNNKETKVEKYGTITDSIISMVKVNGSDTIYILTDDHVVYKVTEQGTNKELVENIVNAQKLVSDFENNLYYYTADKDVYVKTADAIKKFEGLPQKPDFLDILRPPFIIEDGIPVIADKKTYIVYGSGLVEEADFVLEARPSAYALEGTLMQYYGYNKKIYEYNILTLLITGALQNVKDYLEDNTDKISSIATRSRSDLRA